MCVYVYGVAGGGTRKENLTVIMWCVRVCVCVSARWLEFAFEKKEKKKKTKYPSIPPFPLLLHRSTTRSLYVYYII